MTAPGDPTAELAHNLLRAGRQDLVAGNVSGELVILSLRDGVYYGLDRVASRIWRLLEEPAPVRSVCSRLLEEYAEVDAAECEADVLALLEQLLTWSLIEQVQPEAA